jgi:tetratricopeptide (TPR) repeat protein
MIKMIFLLFISVGIFEAKAQTNARDNIKQALHKEKTDTGRVLLLAELSFMYLESKPDTTMILALQALSLAREIGFVKGEAASLNRVGNVYRAFGNNYPKAMEIYLQALKLNEKINNTDGIQRNYANIAVIYNLQGDYRQALEYLFKSKTLAENLNNNESISIVLANMGDSYSNLKFYDSARIYFQQSYNIASGVNYARVMGSSLSDLGKVYFETGQDNLALEFYRLSIAHLKKADHDRGLSNTYLGMAKVFEKNLEGDSALYYAMQSIMLANRLRLTIQIRDAGRFLSAYYRNKKKPDSAFFYQDITKAANDSLFSQQKSNQMQCLVFDEKIRQQEMAIAEIKTKQERKNNLQYAAIVVGLISFIILFFVLSRSIIVKEKFIKFFGIVGLLAVFEFINLYIHPYLDRVTNHSPFLMLVMLICIGSLLVPLHHKMEKWITMQMVEKNKKIRLAAAKKTVAKLEAT